MSRTVSEFYGVYLKGESLSGSINAIFRKQESINCSLIDDVQKDDLIHSVN
jgi:hypothetical protein